MSLHYQSTNGLQGVVKTDKGIKIQNARLKVDNATPGLGFNGSDQLDNLWYDKPAESDVDINSNKITNLADPTSAQDGATKIYVDDHASIPQLRRGARAYYEFENDLTDSIGTYDGTDNGTSFVSGKLGQAIDTNGGSGYVDVGSAFDWGSDDFSVSVWYYPNSDSVAPGVFLANNVGSDPMTSLEYSSATSGHFRFLTWDVDGSVSFETNNSYSAQTWHHVVFTRTGSTGKIYVDGQLDKQGTVADKDIGSASNGFIGDKGNQLEDGLIDEVGVWDRVLSDSEVSYLYNGGPGQKDFTLFDWYSRPAQNDVNMNSNKITNVKDPLDPQDVTTKNYVESLTGVPPLQKDLRAYYNFDGDYKDSTNNGYDGTASNTSFTTGMINNAVDVTGGYVNVGDAFNWQSGDFSASCWVYPSVSPSSDTVILGTFSNGNGTLLIYRSSNNFAFYTDNNGVQVFDTVHTYSPGQWYFITITRTGSTGEIWINGQLEESGTINSGNISASPTDSVIGARDSGNNSTFDGNIDECGIWDRVLTQGEIQHLYNNGSGNGYLSNLEWYSIRQSNHINMNDYRITNLGEALHGSDAVDKAYVDSRAPMAQLEQGAKGYWALDNDYTDSINGYDGTATGTSFNASNAVINQALEFTASTEEVNVGRGLAFDTGDFSVSVWVYPKAANSNRNRVISIDKGFSPNRSNLNYNSNFTFFTNSGSNVSITTPDTYPTKQWHHVVVTRTGSTGQIWVNGQKAQEGTVASGSLSDPGDNSLIGGDSGGNNGAIDGLVDEIASFTRVLTPNEIKYLYHEGQGTNDFVSYDYTFNYDIDMNNNKIINTEQVLMREVSINDDSVHKVPVTQSMGKLIAHLGSQSMMDLLFDMANNVKDERELGTDFTVAYGSASGSTDVDGKVNIWLDNSNSEIDIENRSGSTATVRYSVYA